MVIIWIDKLFQPFFLAALSSVACSMFVVRFCDCIWGVSEYSDGWWRISAERRRSNLPKSLRVQSLCSVRCMTMEISKDAPDCLFTMARYVVAVGIFIV